jgi:hypothetical protein
VHKLTCSQTFLLHCCAGFPATLLNERCMWCCLSPGCCCLQRLWGTMVSHAAKVVAAGLGELRQEHANLKLNPTSTFEVSALSAVLGEADSHPRWLGCCSLG